MPAPSLCGSFLGSKRALLAFTWTLTTILTLVAFLASIAFIIQINSHYKYLERINNYNDDNNNGNGNGNNQNNRYMQEDEDGDEQHSQDDKKEQNWYPLLAGTSSGAMTFVGVYTMFLSLALQFYGITAIVGFTSLQGAYIAPCFPNRNRLKIGIFGGAVVVFANSLLLTAVIFGEFRVEDYREDQDGEDLPPYAVERIATVLAVTCMFLSVLYATFAVLLFLAYASDSSPSPLEEQGDRANKPLAEHHHRHQQFITIEAP